MTCPRCGKPSPYIGAQCTDCPSPEPRVVKAIPVCGGHIVGDVCCRCGRIQTHGDFCEAPLTPSHQTAPPWPSGNPWTVLAVIGVVRSLGWHWTWLGTDEREKWRVRL